MIKKWETASFSYNWVVSKDNAQHFLVPLQHKANLYHQRMKKIRIDAIHQLLHSRGIFFAWFIEFLISKYRAFSPQNIIQMMLNPDNNFSIR